MKGQLRCYNAVMSEKTKTPTMYDMFSGMLKDHLGRSEFADALKKIVEQVQKLKLSNAQDITAMRQHLNQLSDALKKDHADDLDNAKKASLDYSTRLIKKLVAEYDAKMAALDEKMDAVEDGKPGKDADEEKIIQTVLAQIKLPKQKDAIIDTVQLRENLGIKKLEDDFKRIASMPHGRAGWGAHPLLIQNSSGTVIDKIARIIKFSTNLTTTRSLDGVVTVTASGGSGFTTLTATETPNGVLTVYTFSGASAQPSYLVVDNLWMKATSKSGTVNWTWNNATHKATLTIPATDDVWAVV